MVVFCVIRSMLRMPSVNGIAYHLKALLVQPEVDPYEGADQPIVS